MLFSVNPVPPRLNILINTCKKSVATSTNSNINMTKIKTIFLIYLDILPGVFFITILTL